METDHTTWSGFTWSPDDKLTKINLKFLALNSYSSGILLHSIVMNKRTDLFACSILDSCKIVYNNASLLWHLCQIDCEPLSFLVIWLCLVSLLRLF